MNLTEAQEICFAMAMEHGQAEGVTPQQRRAIAVFGLKVRTARQKLDRARHSRTTGQRLALSMNDLRADWMRRLPCIECGSCLGNPLLKCQGFHLFECALGSSRVRFSPFSPPASTPAHS